MFLCSVLGLNNSTIPSVTTFNGIIYQVYYNITLFLYMFCSSITKSQQHISVPTTFMYSKLFVYIVLTRFMLKANYPCLWHYQFLRDLYFLHHKPTSCLRRISHGHSCSIYLWLNVLALISMPSACQSHVFDTFY